MTIYLLKAIARGDNTIHFLQLREWYGIFGDDMGAPDYSFIIIIILSQLLRPFALMILVLQLAFIVIIFIYVYIYFWK